MSEHHQQAFVIEGVAIGAHRPPYLIAEVAQTHDGSLGAAMAFIEVAKESGADAVKFQTHIAAEESTAREPWRKRFSHQDASRYDYWKRMEFSFEQWKLLKRHTEEVGIGFISSPFSPLACRWLQELGMRTWKIASGEVHNRQLMEWVLRTGDPIILSSGLSLGEESRAVVRELKTSGAPLAFLHCTTQYPTPSSQVGMNVFSEFRADFADIPVGLSDHSGNIVPSVVATYLGADVLEVHLTLHRRMFGPDVSSSLVPEQLRQLADSVRFAWEMRTQPVLKSAQLAGLQNERKIFTRSLVAARDIAAGEPIDESIVAFKKPGGGLPYEDVHTLLGKRARRAIGRDEQLSASDVE